MARVRIEPGGKVLVAVLVIGALLLLFLKVRASVNSGKLVAVAQVQTTPVIPDPKSKTNQPSKIAADQQLASPRTAIEPIKIFFDFNRASINKNVYCIFDRIAGTIRELGEQNVRIMIEGNADSIGPASYNFVLSRMRAARVADSLSKRLGIPLDHIELAANGSTKPRASNITSAGRAENRRTEVHIFF